MEPRTPILLITGSLGSGKTTLLRRILETRGRRLAVLMNEFGEIAIDSVIVEGQNVQIVELAGGCVCCSLTGEFEAAVREIIEAIHPEMIVVEATGVAEADALTYEVEDNLPEVRLDSVVCVVDAYVSTRYPHVGYTTRTQLEVADIVLINKTDLVTPEEVRTVENQVRRYNDRAMLFHTVNADLSPDLLFGTDFEHRPLPGLSRHEHAGEPGPFQSFTYSTDLLLDEDSFREMAEGLPPSVYRAKGLVRFPGASKLFNYVVGRADFEDFPADTTRLVFIGPGLEEDREEVLQKLRESEVPHAL